MSRAVIGGAPAMSGPVLGVPPPDGAVLPAREGPLEQVDVARGSVARLQCLPVLAIGGGPDRAGFRVGQHEAIPEPGEMRRLAHRGGPASMSRSRLGVGEGDAEALGVGDVVSLRRRSRDHGDSDGTGTGGTTDGSRTMPEPAANAPPTSSSAAAASSVMPRPRPNRPPGRDDARGRRVAPGSAPAIAARAIDSASNGPNAHVGVGTDGGGRGAARTGRSQSSASSPRSRSSRRESRPRAPDEDIPSARPISSELSSAT